MWNNLCSIRFSSTFHVIYLDCFSNSVPLHGQRHFVSYTVYALSGCWSTCNFLDLVCVIVIIVVPPVLSKIIHLCTCCSASSHFSKSCPPYIVHCQSFFSKICINCIFYVCFSRCSKRRLVRAFGCIILLFFHKYIFNSVYIHYTQATPRK